MACINVNIDLCNTIKRCPVRTVKNHFVTTQYKTMCLMQRVKLTNLPNAIIMISKFLVVEAKLINKVSRHLLDLVI